MTKGPTRAIAGVGVALAMCGGAAGQNDRRNDQLTRLGAADYRLRVDTSLGMNERSVIDAGGFFSYSFLNLNDSDANSRRLFQYDTSLYARAVFDRSHTLFGRARFRALDFSPGDSFSGRGDEWTEPFIDRYWYMFDSRQAAAAYEGRREQSGFSVQAGRQFVDWGQGLVLSENLYAARPNIYFNESWTLEGLAGMTPGDESVVDFDASRADYNSDTKRGFFGGLLQHRSANGRRIYGYALHMPDYNDSAETRLGLGIPVEFDYEATYFGLGMTGVIGDDWVYGGEVVYEVGTSMSDPLRGVSPGVQTEEDISAFGGRVILTHLIRDANSSQAQVEVLVGSGDSDRLTASDTVGGNLTGTDDLGFNALGFVNTGLALSPGLSNIFAVRAGYSTYPFRDDATLRDLQVGADVFLLAKLNEHGPIDEPTLDKHLLGPEIDLALNYRATSDLAFTARYGVFFPGPAIAGKQDARHFIMISFTLSF